MHTPAQAVRYHAAGIYVDADAAIPAGAPGVVLFVHGSGSSRVSPRNQFVANHLQSRGLGTVLMDLLTPDEERADQFTGQLRFDIGFLARRVFAVLDDVREHAQRPIALFGASTGAAAALVVAATPSRPIAAVVSRGGRPDLAGAALAQVQTPTLLIVGGDDREVLALNEKAMERMKTDVRLEVVPGASHLFHEPGALETVAHLAGDWFTRHMGDDRPTPIVQRR